MTAGHDGAGRHVDLRTAAVLALGNAARRCGVDARGARLIRLFGSAVYHLPAAGAVARIAVAASAESLSRRALAVTVTRWLAEIGFPTVEPLAVGQPVASDGCVVTFWRYLPQDGPEPGVADLGRLLRELHQLGTPPVALPAYQPLGSVRRAIESSRALGEEDRGWLRRRCEQLLHAYGQLGFGLPAGLIHGDAYRGNLLRGRRGAVLADWDAVSSGPREVDLIPTLQAPRFGLPERERDAFVAAYGHDIRAWPGFAVMRDIRELSTISALLRDAHASPAARCELRTRLRSLHTGNDQRWTAF